MNIVNKILYKTNLTKIKKGKHVRISKKIDIQGKICLEDGVRVICSEPDDGVTIGKDVKICEYTTIITAGGSLQIGEGSQLGANNYITCQGGVEIGAHVLSASNLSMISSEHQYQDVDLPILDQGSKHAPIKIGDDSWIGINVTILSGTTIGKHCVIGANSLVRGDFPDYSVIVGNPARVVKRYDEEKRQWVKAM